MPDRLSIHAPTLVNTIGHAAGAIIFGILLYLLFNDWRRNPSGKPFLPSAAAALALLWNLGSMVGLATDPQSGFFADLIIASSFSVLSFLPAVLLHLSAAELKPLVVAGYMVSTAAAALHFADLFTGAARYHYAAILVITIGFGVLTGAVLVWRGAAGRPHLAAAMGLFLFSISFAHFNSHLGAQHGGRAWSGEIALHHCGIPLALFVLLQDYRFLLLDTFIRFLVNACLAAGAVGLLVFFGTKFDPLREVTAEPFYAGLVFVGACVLLILFGWLRRGVQDFVTRALFLRANPEKTGVLIQELGARSNDEGAFLDEAAKLIAGFIGCDRFAWGTTSSNPGQGWVEIALPVHFAQGDGRVLRLGARRGGRMFLSEDVSALERLLLEVSRQIDRLRAAEMQALMMKGELQALQAQINPHFLFNTLNTIYGSIPRDNSLARNLILNLSEILRYSLSRGQTLIPLEEEVRTVRAYLDIEQARLGPRLCIEMDVDHRASKVKIPAFSIQPLVENAVKYGAAAQAGAGYVKLTIGFEQDCIQIAVANSGGYPGTSTSPGNGLALNNVRRRLDICYGAAARFRIEGDARNTVVRFDVPARQLAAT